MRFPAIVAFALAVPGAAAAQKPANGPVATVPVVLSNFHFTPALLHLRAGVPIVLVLRNVSRGSHNFSAPEFFAAAQINPASVSRVRNGKAELPGLSDVAIALVPTAGHFPINCTHPVHSSLGMKATIIVD